MRYAVVDTGSNTIRLGVYEEEHGNLKQIHNGAIFANLAGFIEDGALTDEGILRACDALLLQKQKAELLDAVPHFFATAAIRNAKNTDAIVKKIKAQTGITLEVLSGEDEALFSFLGASSDFPNEKSVMADVGGGSSEVILFENGEMTASKSLPWGSLKAYKTFVSGNLPTKDEIKKIQEEISKLLSETPAFQGETRKNICIVGGGVRAAKILSEMLLNKSELSVSAIDCLLEIIAETPDRIWRILEEKIPKRATTIAPGLSIYSAVGHFFGGQTIFISDNGIKEGYVKKRLLQKEKTTQEVSI